MRIASISDLHMDFAENREVLVRMAAEIHRKKADVLIVAGDISHKDDRIERTLLALKEVAQKVAYIPGNHELWSDLSSIEAGADTWTRYRNGLKTLVERLGVHYLPSAPLVCENVAIAGSCGWYDYSFAHDWAKESARPSTFESKKLGPLAWRDAKLVSFKDEEGRPMSDADVTETMEAELAAQLEAAEHDSEVEHTVAVTHHQAFAEVVHRTGTMPWEFFTAFMGSRRFGETILKYRKVRAAIFGHSHIVRETRIQNVRVYGTALGYPRERKDLNEEEVVATRIGWLEL